MMLIRLTKTWWIIFTAVIFLFSSCWQPVPNRHNHHRSKKSAPIAVVKSDTIQRDSFYITAVGDIMLGTSYPNNSTLPPDSAKGSFKNVLKELRNADVVFG